MVYQERNEHDLMKDFKDEIPGYLENNRIISILSGLNLKAGTSVDVVCENLKICYQALVEKELFKPDELDLVNAWVSDMRGLL